MQILDEVKRVLSSKAKGDRWVESAVGPLVEVNIEIKELETKKKDECEEYRLAIKQVDEKYKAALDVLGEIDSRLRERVMKEHEGTKSVGVDGIGEFVFAPGSWQIEIMDMKKIDPKYKITDLDRKAIETDAKNGMQNFAGMRVTRGRSLRVMTKRD